MGTYNTKTPNAATRIARIVNRAITNPALVAVAAMTLSALSVPTQAYGQNGSILPRFAGTILEPAQTGSATVNMKLMEFNSGTDQSKNNYFQRPKSPRVGMSPKSYLSPARFRAQDGDVFGEGQAAGGDPVSPSTVKSPIKESPFKRMPPKLPANNQLRNPLETPEANLRLPVPSNIDPTPRTPPMDTIPVKPKLPLDAEFTPDRVPPMPKPGIDGADGGTRESERARTAPPMEVPDDTGETGDPEGIELEPFTPDDSDLTEDDPDARRPTNTRQRENEAKYDDPRRPFRSNIYRPAREPSYYSSPQSKPYAPGANPIRPNPMRPDPNAPNAYAQNPYFANPYAANPYAANPYAANPYAANGLRNPYAMNPYGMAPVMVVCPSACNSCPTAPAANSFAGCPTPTPAPVDSGVYENVVNNRVGLGLCGRGSGANNPLTQTGVPLYYISLFGGWSDLSDLEIVNEEGTINIDSDNGFGFGGAFGQIQGRNLRSELELSYRNHDTNTLFLNDLGTGSETINGAGDFESFAGMLNVYWEFVDSWGERFSPYVGLGIGAVNVTADLQLPSGQDAFTDGEDSSFAYQYIVGVNYKLQSYSDLFIEYRHFAADSLRFDTDLPAGSLLDGDGELNYQTNNIFFGMRLKF